MRSLKLVLLWSVLLLPQWGSAQYIPLFDFSQWFLTEVNPQSSTFDWYQTGKDSTINGKDYLQTYDGSQTLPMWLREVPDSQRVYATAPWDGWTERLIYDFSLAAGDTTALTFRYAGTKRFVVDNIDAVNSTQGFLPRLNLLNIDGGLPASLQWTAGVGAFTNPFYLDLPISSDTTFMLICNYHDGIKLWDDGFGNCPGVPPPLAAEGALDREYPQVALLRERFEVEVPPGKPWKVKVFDLQGGMVMEKEVRGGRRLSEGAGWEKGMYLIRVENEGGGKTFKWMLHP